MSDTPTLGQIGYEAYGEDSGWKAYDGRPMPRWADLRPDIKNRWEVSSQAIGAHIKEQVLASFGSKVEQRTIDILTYKIYRPITDKPQDFRIFSFNEAWLHLNRATEDHRKGIIGGKCIQCRNPHFDGMCECGKDRLPDCEQCANPDLKGIHTCRSK